MSTFVKEITPLPENILEQLYNLFGVNYEFLSLKFDNRNQKYLHIKCKICNNESERPYSSLKKSLKLGKTVCVFCNKKIIKSPSYDWLNRLNEYEIKSNNYIDNKEYVKNLINDSLFASKKTKLLIKSKSFNDIFDVKTAASLLCEKNNVFWQSVSSGVIDKYLEQKLLINLLEPSYITKEFTVDLPSGKHRVDYYLEIDKIPFYINFGYYGLGDFQEKTSIFNTELKQKFKENALVLYKIDYNSDNLLNNSLYETRKHHLYDKIANKAQMIIKNFILRSITPKYNTKEITNLIFPEALDFYNYYFDFYQMNKTKRIKIS